LIYWYESYIIGAHHIDILFVFLSH